VPKAIGDFIVLRGLYETGGCGVAVCDEDILKAVKTLAADEGLFICPEGAATVCAAAQLTNDGWLKPDETVLLLNTGCGLKYADTLDVDAPVLKPGDDLPDL
jgi:threonine synthase